LIEISFVVANYHYSAEIHDEIKCVRNAGSLMLYPKYLTYKGRGNPSAVVVAPPRQQVCFQVD
jgi:hypothetical protein